MISEAPRRHWVRRIRVLSLALLVLLLLLLLIEQDAPPSVKQTVNRAADRPAAAAGISGS